ncbi:unnamed protein product [Trifolium pratense]|uniref:Uncharacterized protein n=1 Tax=Trifolium pratense TaxID=57577 RepID=A0ACB0JKQ7_TRIPR|nr:unnamed protein product [Trifolium pratense]
MDRLSPIWLKFLHTCIITNFLVVVIGVMTAISAEREYIRDGKVTKMVVIELTDSSGKCECALCGDYVDDLSKKVGKTASGIPVVVIQFAKVKIFRGLLFMVWTLMLHFL